MWVQNILKNSFLSITTALNVVSRSLRILSGVYFRSSSISNWVDNYDVKNCFYLSSFLKLYASIIFLFLGFYNCSPYDLVICSIKEPTWFFSKSLVLSMSLFLCARYNRKAVFSMIKCSPASFVEAKPLNEEYLVIA